MKIDSFINGNTRVVCLIGNPVKHSLSPQIHNHAFRYLDLPFVYIPLSVHPSLLHSVIHTMRACSFAGANVTIPHKSSVIYYCDELSYLSQHTGTVNTLYFRDNRLCGTTTDPQGFYRALSWMGHDLDGSNVVILGNGGTARTLGIALSLENKISSLVICGRNPDRISSLASHITTITGRLVDYCSLKDSKLRDILNDCNLLVNCTSAGMYPDTEKAPLAADYFHKRMTVFDVIYNPIETRFLAEARRAGCKTQNGLRMLLYQGLSSFKLWTGIDVPEEIYDIDTLSEMIR